MSTALSWTELRTAWTELRTARGDLLALLAFRSSGLAARARRRLWSAAVVVGLLTVSAVLGPACLGGAMPRSRSGVLLALLPSMCLGFLVLVVLAAVASGGGREVVPRDQAVAFPVSPTTEHLGALLLAPLNIAWVLQAWTLLGVTAYAVGPVHLLAVEVPVAAWILAATTLAQVVGWLAEGLRRGPHGVGLSRGIVLVLLTTVLLLVTTGALAPVLDHSPTGVVLRGVLAPGQGRWGLWTGIVAGLVLLSAAAVVGGALPARWALQRPMREELRLESGRHPARATPRSDLGTVLRLDRTAIWRSVPLRRGLTLLAVMPGAVALAGGLDWSMLTVLPGLVASGAALLFGVNTWCLDGRGALWRDSLPVRPRTVFAARVIVLGEVLLGSAALTVLLGALRAGPPSSVQLLALVCSTLVVALQVVAAGMRWSIARPFAVDLRSARATPAPPVVMAGYSARLALSTTLTGLVFSGLASLGSLGLCLAVAATMLLWSAWRLERSAQDWDDPVTRARVIGTVAG